MSTQPPAPSRVLAPFAIEPQPPQPDGVLRAAIRGHLDAEGAAALQEFLDQQLESGVRRVELDFARVPFISSSGVGSLISSVGEYRDEGGDIVLCRMSAGLLSVLKMLDLLDYVTLARG